MLGLLDATVQQQQVKNKLLGCCCRRRRSKVVAEEGSGLAPPTRSARRKAVSTFGARLLRAVPFQKLKILIVVWQILTQVGGLE